MEELNAEIIGTISHETLGSALLEETITEARTLFESSTVPSRHDELRRELADLERAQARLTDAVASGAGAVPALVERLRVTESKRRESLTALDQGGRQTRPRPS
jgi:hypothetical protein